MASNNTSVESNDMIESDRNTRIIIQNVSGDMAKEIKKTISDSGIREEVIEYKDDT